MPKQSDYDVNLVANNKKTNSEIDLPSNKDEVNDALSNVTRMIKEKLSGMTRTS